MIQIYIFIRIYIIRIRLNKFYLIFIRILYCLFIYLNIYVYENMNI